MNRSIKTLIAIGLLSIVNFTGVYAQKESNKRANLHQLEFSELADRWDEGIPLGNGFIGALIWKKDDHLRMSLDHVNLWDLRPMENLSTSEFKFSWVYDKWKSDQYKEVQNKFDVPYDRSPAPSKIPGAALEFNLAKFGKTTKVYLSLNKAVCTVNWDSNIEFSTFVHATKNEGWFKFSGVDKSFKPIIVPPAYTKNTNADQASPVSGQDLVRLGYPKGILSAEDNQLTYIQKGWGDFHYKVTVVWNYTQDGLIGKWNISTSLDKESETISIFKKNSNTSNKTTLSFNQELSSHENWWANYWSKSSIELPDQLLEKQWYMEQYKFGSAARSGAPPISLQSVWTADNGKLPPWKGDFHHDLNTQLSYWSSYSGNHLDLEIGFLEWLVDKRANFKRYTKTYFDSDGLAVPGVTTLEGEPMGGWIQYAFGPTVSGWLGQHFYLHWRYSMDRKFLKDYAYPWIEDVAKLFQDISVVGENGMRKLPISSSPEINNNSRKAWFDQTTNFDLASIRWTFEKAAELALELGKKQEAEKWQKQLKQWPYFASDPQSGLMIAPEKAYENSHRHFSHLLAFHPYGLIDYSKGGKDKQMIDNSLRQLNAIGTDYFTGYSFSWLANMQARAFDGEAAARTLSIFAENFCLPNSFHVNGEQHNKGYSKFKYRPFTLEGNFAFAAGIQEMLLQSHAGYVQIFPAIPSKWNDLSFNSLRAQGAFLVSARREAGKVKSVQIQSKKGGTLKFKNPFGFQSFKCNSSYKKDGDFLVFQTKKNQTILLAMD